MTAVAATNTATATATPAATCSLIVLPLLHVVHRGGEQAILYATAPHVSIGTSLRTHAAYPASVQLFTDQANGTVLSGKPIPDGYHFTFNSGNAGLAVIVFHIPTKAPTKPAVIVTARSTCSSTRITQFKVAGKGKSDDKEFSTRASNGRTQLEFALPDNFQLEQGARLVSKGAVHILTVKLHGHMRQLLDYSVTL